MLWRGWFFCSHFTIWLSSSLSKTLVCESKRKNTAQTWSSLFAVMYTGGHKVETQHTVLRNMQFRGAVQHARRAEMNQNRTEMGRVRQPSLLHANSWAAMLSGHWHRLAVTPLPGVSAPAGLRPSPPEPLFAAAQPSLCPVSAGKAGQYILRQVNTRQSSSGVPWEEAYPHLGTWNLWTSR